MSKFTNPIIISPLSDGKTWRLVESFSYYIEKKDGETIDVPAGFVTGKYIAAAILHDYLYYSKTFSREKSDLIFLEAMKILKVSKLKRKIIYWIVRLFGDFAWKSHRGSSLK